LTQIKAGPPRRGILPPMRVATGDAGMLRLTALLVALAAALPAVATADEPLVYEMVVTSPGTRSQGIRGILYGPDGAARDVPAGAEVDSALGRFRSVPCETLWSVCGVLREDMLAWIGEHPINGLHEGPTGYRVYRAGSPDEPPAWRGVLLEGDAIVPDSAAPLSTAMGTFRPGAPLSADAPWSGWIPESWRDAWPDRAGHGLEGTTWRFVEIAGAPLPADARATLAFGAGSAVSGDAGCNRFGGRYEATAAAPAFTAIGYTKMMCYGREMEVELALQSVFGRAYRAEAENGDLRLLAADGSILARLVPASP
jgi:heat shock protein HslJ